MTVKGLFDYRQIFFNQRTPFVWMNAQQLFMPHILRIDDGVLKILLPSWFFLL